MRGIWSQVITLAGILQIALVTGKALIQQNQQAQQQLELKDQYQQAAQKRIGYDYPAPPSDLVNPFQDHGGLGHDVIDHHDDHDHHDHHDPGYWKKKLIWKPGWKKIWKPGKKQIWKSSWALKQIWVPDWKEIWVPGVKKIWKPVWISEWFPSPDHHDHHHHESHVWDRSDNNTAASLKSAAVQAAPQPPALKPPQQSTWQFPK